MTDNMKKTRKMKRRRTTQEKGFLVVELLGVDLSQQIPANSYIRSRSSITDSSQFFFSRVRTGSSFSKRKAGTVPTRTPIPANKSFH